MSDRKPDPRDAKLATTLDSKLAQLVHEVQPQRDLWPAIAAAISQAAPPSARAPQYQHAQRFNTARWWQLAAVVLLMVASSALTYVLTQRSLQGQLLQARQEVVQQMQPVLATAPASFGYQRLGPEYSRLHAELDARVTRYLQSVPSAERTKIEGSLADLRRAASELSAQLAEHPSDPLLQELLLSTYQNEIGLLSRVNDLGAASGLGANL